MKGRNIRATRGRRKFTTDYMDLLANIFVRPPKAEYTLGDLGPTRFQMMLSPRLGRTSFQAIVWIERTDFEVINPRGHRLKCSMWQVADVDLKRLGLPHRAHPDFAFLIHLHGNSGSRMDCLYNGGMISLQYGLGLVAFDFSACGQSEGDYITLGLREPGDVACIVAYLDGLILEDTSTTTSTTTTTSSTIPSASSLELASPRIARVVLWGRSMGAVTALRFSTMFRDAWPTPRVACLILDSPFSDLWALGQHVANNFDTVPQISPHSLIVLITLIRFSRRASCQARLQWKFFWGSDCWHCILLSYQESLPWVFHSCATLC
jgi:hypothetical protein